MSTLSVFIDESGEVSVKAGYYVLTLLFHHQVNDISSQLAKIEHELEINNLPSKKAIHTGPIIRREDEYKTMTLETRRLLFDKILSFTRICNIKHKSFVYEKREYPDRVQIAGRISRDMTLFFKDHLEYFQSFDTINVYYDNGQAEITSIVNSVFNANFYNVNVRKVIPSDYRLFQSADLLCTLEMLNAKYLAKRLTNSERMFFMNNERLAKTYLKPMRKMRFEQ